MNSAIEHLAEEIEAMEHVNPWGRAIRWIVGLGAAAAIVAGLVWTLTSPPSVTSGSRMMTYIPANVAVIEIGEPMGGTLSDAPVRFTWESVTGRLQYIVRVYEKGATMPLVERASTTPTVELTPEERAKL